MRVSWSALAVALAGIALSVSPAVALPLLAPATSPAPPAADFGERIDVRAIDVEAAVTDRSGKRVSGLSAADFRLLVDGKEVPPIGLARATPISPPPPKARSTSKAGRS